MIRNEAQKDDPVLGEKNLPMTKFLCLCLRFWKSLDNMSRIVD
jgi:hypothetical protein